LKIFLASIFNLLMNYHRYWIKFVRNITG